MNTHLKLGHSDMASYARSASFRGAASYRLGNIRAVTLDGRVINALESPSAARAVQEAIEEVFGMDERDIRMETGGNPDKKRDAHHA